MPHGAQLNGLRSNPRLVAVGPDYVGPYGPPLTRMHIHLYHGDANMLKESLEVVQRTSTVILGAISPKDAVSIPAATEVLQ